MQAYNFIHIQPFYIHHTELEDFVLPKFYYPHAIADSNQCIWIRKKMPEFSSTMLPNCFHTILLTS